MTDTDCAANPPAVLTVRQAAAELGVSANLVYALGAAGRLRHERHGLGRGAIRIPREALDEYRRSAQARVPQAGPPLPPLRHLRIN